MKRLIFIIGLLILFTATQAQTRKIKKLVADTIDLVKAATDGTVDSVLTIATDRVKKTAAVNINESRMTQLTADTIRSISADDADTLLTITLTIDVADDDSIAVFPDATTIDMKFYIHGDDEWALGNVQTDGTCSLPVTQGSVVNTDTDTNLCLYNSGGGTTAVIRNRLGASKKITVIYSHLE